MPEVITAARMRSASSPPRILIQPAAEQHQAMIALESALMALPLRQRQVFILRVWEGLDVAQTAAAMGCGEGSVKTHFFRAINALRAQLGDHWP